MGAGTRFLTKIIFAMTPCVIPLSTSFAAGALSQYGQIQNVQNYSSNPFWSPNGPYNQKMPQPVYATGPQVTTEDCQTIVYGLIAAVCASQDNCQGKRVSDIRPTVMLDLSRMPGHNYAAACAGYMDSAFKEYQSQFMGMVTPTAFPVAYESVPQPQEYTIQNQYTPPPTPKWKQEMQDRDAELRALQAANGVITDAN